MGLSIAVLGLGPSLSLYEPEDYVTSIGVNDIWRYHKTDVVDRWLYIDSCTPSSFYSQIVNWDYKPSFKYIELTEYYPAVKINLDIRQFYKSYCSPFVACQIAWREYGAKEIHLFGVDMVDHPILDTEMCRKSKKHFLLLAQALDTKGCKLIVHGGGILK